MTRRIVFALVALLLAGAADAYAGTRPRALDYAVELAGDRLRVELAFDGNASGSTSLQLPSDWGGQRGLHAAVRDLEALTPGARLADTSVPHVKIVTHAPGERVRVRYSLVTESERPLKPGRGVGYRAIVQPSFVHVLGHNAWVHPVWDDSMPVRVTLSWEGLPESWSLANSFGVNRRKQTFETQLGSFDHAV